MTEEIYEVLSEVLVKMNIFWLSTVFVIVLCVFVFTEIKKTRNLIIYEKNIKRFADGEVIHIQLPNNARGNELRKEIQKIIASEYSDVSYEISYGVDLRIVEPNTTTTENAHM